MNWENFFRFLCVIGWHEYKDWVEDSSGFIMVQQGKCKHCGKMIRKLMSE